ncbi:hypothetical protein [Paraburkholderia hayleyella]|uniref:hypothetical protein n=1 Tax=Paraburkholderia hayleyella TaxID=2152889 RepID=UPI001291F3CF|nr:hypothetical protein [Paraburkholderia hayleyella]
MSRIKIVQSPNLQSTSNLASSSSEGYLGHQGGSTTTEDSSSLWLALGNTDDIERRSDTENQVWAKGELLKVSVNPDQTGQPKNYLSRVTRKKVEGFFWGEIKDYKFNIVEQRDNLHKTDASFKTLIGFVLTERLADFEAFLQIMSNNWLSELSRDMSCGIDLLRIACKKREGLKAVLALAEKDKMSSGKYSAQSMQIWLCNNLDGVAPLEYALNTLIAGAHEVTAISQAEVVEFLEGFDQEKLALFFRKNNTLKQSFLEMCFGLPQYPKCLPLVRFTLINDEIFNLANFEAGWLSESEGQNLIQKMAYTCRTIYSKLNSGWQDAIEDLKRQIDSEIQWHKSFMKVIKNYDKDKKHYLEELGKIDLSDSENLLVIEVEIVREIFLGLARYRRRAADERYRRQSSLEQSQIMKAKENIENGLSGEIKINSPILKQMKKELGRQIDELTALSDKNGDSVWLSDKLKLECKLGNLKKIREDEAGLMHDISDKEVYVLGPEQKEKITKILLELEKKYMMNIEEPDFNERWTADVEWIRSYFDRTVGDSGIQGKVIKKSDPYLQKVKVELKKYEEDFAIMLKAGQDEIEQRKFDLEKLLEEKRKCIRDEINILSEAKVALKRSNISGKQVDYIVTLMQLVKEKIAGDSDVSHIKLDEINAIIRQLGAN